MDYYTSLKKEAEKVASRCAKLADSCGCRESSAAIEEIERTISDNKLVIMAIGEARMGKSSLLSAYLDDNALFPVDLDVTTCLITMVTYSKKEKITVILSDKDGEKTAKKITRDEIFSYAKEQNNPNGQKGALMILVETPNEILKDGTVFVDSPGIGSLNPIHSQLTFQFLPRADLLLFITDAAAQISTSEVNFLKNVYKSCQNILFVLTKKDLQYDCSELIEQNRRVIAEEVGIPADEQVHVAVSSNLLTAYRRTNDKAFLEESNFCALDHAISSMIYTKRPQVTLLPRLMTISHEMGKIGQSISVEETTYGNDLTAVKTLQKELEALEKARRDMLDNSDDWDTIIRDRVQTLETELTDMLADYSAHASKYIDACLEKSEYTRNPDQLKNEIIVMTEQKIQDMQTYAADAVDRIQYDLEQESGLCLDMEEQELSMNKNDGSGITFKKNSAYEQIAETGQSIRKNSFVLNAVGGVLGAAAGGVAGFFVGGPAGAFGGALVGADAGKELGGLIGAGKGVVDVVTQGTSYNIKEIQKLLKGYVSDCVQKWSHSKQKFIKNVSDSIKHTLRKKVKASQSELKAQIQTLAKRSKLSAKELDTSKQRVTALRNEYEKLLPELEDITRRCILPIPGPNALESGQEGE